MRKALKPIFSRKIISFLIFLVQVLFILRTIDKFNPISASLYKVATALSVVAILFEINRDVSPSFKIIWIALFAVFPLFGLFLYLYVHMDLFNFGRKKALNEIKHQTGEFIKTMDNTLTILREQEPEECGIFNYLYDVGKAPCVTNTAISYFRLGEDMYTQLVEDIKREAEYKAIVALNQALDEGTFFTETDAEDEYDQESSRQALELIKKEKLPDEVKANAKKIIVDEYKKMKEARNNH